MLGGKTLYLFSFKVFLSHSYLFAFLSILFRFNIFFNACFHFLYDNFNASDSVFHLLFCW